jgi:hypothetical protein
MAASRYRKKRFAMIEGTARPDIWSRGNPVDDRTSNLLKGFGFDPGIPVYDFVKIEFDIEEVKRALFDSNYSDPVTLPFRSETADSATPTNIDLQMVVELVRTSYSSYETEIDGVGINRYDSPEYYLRGYLYKGGDNRESVVMHVYLRVGGRNELDSATVQIVAQPSGADPSTTMRCGFDSSDVNI